MKNGKLHKASGTLKVLLGLVAAGALLLASCQNIFDSPSPAQEDRYGKVIVVIGDLYDGRTIMPDAPVFSNYTSYDYTFKNKDGRVQLEALNVTSSSDVFVLPFGEDYTLEVKAYNGSGDQVAEGVSTPFTVAEVLATVKVGLSPFGDVNGTFKYVFNYNALATSSPVANVTITLKKWNGNTEEDVAGFTVPTPAVNVITESGQTLAPGSYLFTIRVYATMSGVPKYWGKTEVVVIYPNVTTDFGTKTLLATELSTIDEDNAIRILKEGILSWAEAGKLVNSEVNITAGTPSDTAVTLYYINSTLGSPGALAFTPQGGWALHAGDNTTTTAGKTITLEFGVTPLTYTVNLLPVVKYTVDFDPTAIRYNLSSTTMRISFPAAATLDGRIQQFNRPAASANTSGGGVVWGKVVSTDISLAKEADLTTAKDIASPVWALEDLDPLDATTNKVTFTPASDKYLIRVHEAEATQWSSAVRNLAGTKVGTTITAGRIGSWVLNAGWTVNANGVPVRDFDPVVTWDESDTANIVPDSITMNYVSDLVVISDFPIALQEGWGPYTGVWTKGAKQNITLAYKYSTGGYSYQDSPAKTFPVTLQPVARYNVTFPAPIAATDTRSVTVEFNGTGGEEITKSVPSSAATVQSFYTLVLGDATSVTVTNGLMAMKNNTSAVADTSGSNSAAITAATATTDISYIFGIVGTSASLGSKVYDITVYPRYDEQKDAANRKIRAENHKTWVPAAQLDYLATPAFEIFSDTPAETVIKRHDFTRVNEGSEDLIPHHTALYYVGMETGANMTFDIDFPAASEYKAAGSGYSISTLGTVVLPAQAQRRVIFQPFGDRTTTPADVYFIYTKQVAQVIVEYATNAGVFPDPASTALDPLPDLKREITIAGDKYTNDRTTWWIDGIGKYGIYNLAAAAISVNGEGLISIDSKTDPTALDSTFAEDAAALTSSYLTTASGTSTGSVTLASKVYKITVRRSKAEQNEDASQWLRRRNTDITGTGNFVTNPNVLATDRPVVKDFSDANSANHKISLFYLGTTVPAVATPTALTGFPAGAWAVTGASTPFKITYLAKGVNPSPATNAVDICTVTSAQVVEFVVNDAINGIASSQIKLESAATVGPSPAASDASIKTFTDKDTAVLDRTWRTNGLGAVTITSLSLAYDVANEIPIQSALTAGVYTKTVTPAAATSTTYNISVYDKVENQKIAALNDIRSNLGPVAAVSANDWITEPLVTAGAPGRRPDATILRNAAYYTYPIDDLMTDLYFLSNPAGSAIATDYGINTSKIAIATATAPGWKLASGGSWAVNAATVSPVSLEFIYKGVTAASVTAAGLDATYTVNLVPVTQLEVKFVEPAPSSIFTVELGEAVDTPADYLDSLLPYQFTKDDARKTIIAAIGLTPIKLYGRNPAVKTRITIFAGGVVNSSPTKLYPDVTETINDFTTTSQKYLIEVSTW